MHVHACMTCPEAMVVNEVSLDADPSSAIIDSFVSIYERYTLFWTCPLGSKTHDLMIEGCLADPGRSRKH